MATKKTNKKTKQNTSKKTSSNRQKTVDRADAIRVTEIATVAVSVILFCLAMFQATVCGMCCIMYMWHIRYVCRYCFAAFDHSCYSYIFS